MDDLYDYEPVNRPVDLCGLLKGQESAVSVVSVLREARSRLEALREKLRRQQALFKGMSR